MFGKNFEYIWKSFQALEKFLNKFNIFSKHLEIIPNGFRNFSKLSENFWNWFGNVSVLEITTVQIWLTLYCKSKFSSRFIKYRLTNIYLIFWYAVFKPGSFPSHSFDVVEVVDSKFLSVDWGCEVQYKLGCRDAGLP